MAFAGTEPQTSDYNDAPQNAIESTDDKNPGNIAASFGLDPSFNVAHPATLFSSPFEYGVIKQIQNQVGTNQVTNNAISTVMGGGSLDDYCQSLFKAQELLGQKEGPVQGPQNQGDPNQPIDLGRTGITGGPETAQNPPSNPGTPEGYNPSYLQGSTDPNVPEGYNPNYLSGPTQGATTGGGTNAPVSTPYQSMVDEFNKPLNVDLSVLNSLKQQLQDKMASMPQHPGYHTPQETDLANGLAIIGQLVSPSQFGAQIASVPGQVAVDQANLANQRDDATYQRDMAQYQMVVGQLEKQVDQAASWAKEQYGVEVDKKKMLEGLIKDYQDNQTKESIAKDANTTKLAIQNQKTVQALQKIEADTHHKLSQDEAARIIRLGDGSLSPEAKAVVIAQLRAMDKGIPPEQQVWAHLSDDQIMNMANSTSGKEDNLAASAYAKNMQGNLAGVRADDIEATRADRIAKIQAATGLDSAREALVHEQTQYLPENYAIRWGQLSVAQGRLQQYIQQGDVNQAKTAIQLTNQSLKEQKAMLDSERNTILYQNGGKAPQQGSPQFNEWNSLGQRYSDLAGQSASAISAYKARFPVDGSGGNPGPKVSDNISFSDRAKNDTVNPSLLQDIANSGFHVMVGTAKSGHSDTTVTGNPSRHMAGNAVDITEINGFPVTTPQGKAYGDQLAMYLQNKGYTRNTENGNDKAVLWQTNTGGNHFNHLHVSRNSNPAGNNQNQNQNGSNAANQNGQQGSDSFQLPDIAGMVGLGNPPTGITMDQSQADMARTITGQNTPINNPTIQKQSPAPKTGNSKGGTTRSGNSFSRG